MDRLNQLIEMITEFAEGRYTGDIMELTGQYTEEPVRTIAEALGGMMAKVEARESRLERLTRQVEETNRRTRRDIIATVSTMAKALAARDSYTEGHAERVGQIAGLIAAEMDMSEEDTELVQLAGLLHDIGKIGFPDYLFLPHEGHSPPEIVQEITRHPTTGAEILKDLDFLGSALSYIRCHHERPDGLSYPNRLKDHDIPLGAKIIAAADAFDAITTDRPYHKAKTYQEALEILKEGSGTQWDPECVSVFERILPKIPSHGGGTKAPAERLQCLWDNQAEIVLTPGPVGGARLRWIRLGTDFSRYHGLMFDRVIFFFAPDSEYKGMDPQELKELADLFHRQFKNVLKKNYPIVKAPSPGVVRIRCAITDLKQSRPVLSEIWPSGFGLTKTGKGLKSSWTDSGATSIEVMVLDSVTNTPILAAIDDQKTGLREKFTKWGSAEDAFRFWANRTKLFLDQVSKEKG
ncbi:MAG: Cyclic di-GMP phosphodiesterase response regulator RpfG [Syntrophus sp. PtaU1.Bin208]|nr:MAG: Cyclic di-GMP phosphodiesterase response regulator RpfG [Syntrophus sp. PtaU1.Bin208]